MLRVLGVRVLVSRPYGPGLASVFVCMCVYAWDDHAHTRRCALRIIIPTVRARARFSEGQASCPATVVGGQVCIHVWDGLRRSDCPSTREAGIRGD